MAKVNMKPVLILDKHRGIYFGYLKSTKEGGNAVVLEGARHCFYYTATGAKGVYSLAVTGPGPGSKIGPRVCMTVRDVSKVVDCAEAAVTAWENASW